MYLKGQEGVVSEFVTFISRIVTADIPLTHLLTKAPSCMTWAHSNTIVSRYKVLWMQPCEYLKWDIWLLYVDMNLCPVPLYAEAHAGTKG